MEEQPVAVAESYHQWLSTLGSWSAILTAVLATFAYVKYCLERWERRRRLERYLKAEKTKRKDKGQRTALHLTAKLGLTESEILHASFQSSYIERRLGVDPETNLANIILFAWRD